MIGVAGQYVAIFDLDGLTDFLDEAQFEALIMIQTVGGQLPSFEMRFKSASPEVHKKINEGSPLTITYGRDLEGMTTSTFSISNPVITRGGQDNYSYFIKGVLNHQSYINNQSVQIHKSKSSKEVIEICAGRNGLSPDVKASPDDTMNWVQAGVTDFEMIQETYLRSWMGSDSTCASVAITPASEFRYYDLKKKYSSEDWKVSSDDSIMHADVNIGIDYKIENGNSMLNNWMGYGLQTREYDLKTGIPQLIEPSNKSGSGLPICTVGAGSPQFNRSNKETPHHNAYEPFIVENMHPSWHKAYANNMTRLALLSTISIDVTYNHIFLDMKVLDTVKIMDREIFNSEAESNLADMYSGRYFISHVALSYSGRQLSTRVTLSSDANYNMIGSLG